MLDVPPSCESKKVEQGVCGLVLLLVSARGRLLIWISVEEGKERPTLGLTVADRSNWRRRGMYVEDGGSKGVAQGHLRVHGDVSRRKDTVELVWSGPGPRSRFGADGWWVIVTGTERAMCRVQRGSREGHTKFRLPSWVSTHTCVFVVG